MSKLTATRGAQYPLISEFTFNFDDTFVDVNGVTKTFGSVFGDAIVADIINLPQGAVVVGGEVVVETAGVGPTVYTMSLGDASSATRYANAVDLKNAGRSALALSGFRTGGSNVRLTIASTVANATAGTFTVRVLFTLANRVNEVITA